VDRHVEEKDVAHGVVEAAEVGAAPWRCRRWCAIGDRLADF
jgi:hypothetical protein